MRSLDKPPVVHEMVSRAPPPRVAPRARGRGNRAVAPCALRRTPSRTSAPSTSQRPVFHFDAPRLGRPLRCSAKSFSNSAAALRADIGN